jgi:hypothetical protein
MLALVGPGFPSRLWCIMELFVFVTMGRTKEDITVRLLPSAVFKADVGNIDVRKAECWSNTDRLQMYSVIESSYGTLQAFNGTARAVMRTVLPIQVVTSTSQHDA